MTHPVTINTLHRNYPVVYSGDHDYINIPMTTFLTLNPITLNRDSANRVTKMEKTFNKVYANNKLHTMSEFALGIVIQDFIDPETKYHFRANDWYLIDGNTRQHYWKLNPTKASLHTNGLTGKIHYLASMSDVNSAYFMYNNLKSAESISERIQGLIRQHTLNPRSSMLRKGNISTALSWASWSPKTASKPLDEQFKMCMDGLKIIDSTPFNGNNTLFDPVLKGNSLSPVIGAFLLALRLHPHDPNLRKMIEKLATVNAADLKFSIATDLVDAADIIALEYNKLSPLRSITGNAEPWLKNKAGLTDFDSRTIQMDFLMYWISQYMKDPNKTWGLRFGISNRWEGSWVKFFDTVTKTPNLFSIENGESISNADIAVNRRLEKALNLQPHSLTSTPMTLEQRVKRDSPYFQS